MSSTRRGTDGSGDDSHEADSAIPTAASHAPLTPEQPIVPDDPTVIRRPTSSDPVEKQITVISGGGKILPTSNSISTNELGQMLEGEMLGPLRLDKFIGGGGMGAVFRAHDTNLSRTVAVKILLGRGSGGDLKKRFQLEAQSAARLDHENIARVFYVGEHDNWNYIVFEYIDGINIRDLVHQHGPLLIDDVVNYTLQVAEALHHASRRDVVHRDIKPSNVLVTPTGRAKLVDMGLARLHHLDSTNDDLTASGVTLGTFDYISPEQARDPRVADVRSDIYSLGCTLFFMLSGRPPFPEGTVLQKLLSHTSDDPPNIHHYRSDIPLELGSVLNTMLAKSPHARQQTASQLIGELLLVADKHNLSSATRSGTVWVTPAKTTLTFWEKHVSWIMSCMLLLAIVSAWGFFRSSPVIQPNEPIVVHVQESTTSPTSTAAEDAIGTTSSLEPSVGQTNDREPENDPDIDHSEGPETLRDTNTEFAPSNIDNSVPNTPLKTQNEPPTAPSDSGEAMPTNTPEQNQSTENPEANQPGSDSPDEPHLLAGQPALIVVGAPNDEPVNDVMFFADLDSALNYLYMDARHARRLKAIELRYSGHPPTPQRPVTVRLPRVTLRAGEGYAPILTFNSGDFDHTSMITLRDTELTLQSIHFEVQLPYPVDQWSFFELHGTSQLSLNDCTVTMKNSARGRKSFYENAAFFRLAQETDSITIDQDERSHETDTHELSVELQNCILRGEASVIRAQPLTPAQFVWSNGVLITTEYLLDVTVSAVEPGKQSPLVEVVLSHVTAAADQGLCRLRCPDRAPHQDAVVFQCNESVILLPDKEPLILQQSTSALESLTTHVHFQGNHNVFLVRTDPTAQTSTPYLIVEPVADSSTLTPETYDYESWTRLFHASSDSWYELPIPEWSLPGTEHPTHTLTANDYTWEQLLQSDGAQNYSFSAGAEIEQLPQFPELLSDAPLRSPEPNTDIQ